MRVLVLNPGSSTLKYRLLEVSTQGEIQHADGLVDHVGTSVMDAAAQEVITRCKPLGIEAVGCRVVHGGEAFRAPTRVTAEVIAGIRDLGRLAPLHNPAAARVLESLAQLMPEVPVVAVFDTAFHATMPDVAGLYALPRDLARNRGLRRYGFHGTSHQYVSGRLISLLNKVGQTSKVITCHLGNGASLCAVRNGESIDTSMGLTPLEGLIMGTRSGDVDPGLVVHLMRAENLSADAIDQLLNRESGLLGLCGHADMREVQQAANQGDARAAHALEAFAYRIRKYVGAYAAALEGLDGLAFTAGIGEHSAIVRRLVCEQLGWLGIRLDHATNEQPGRGEVRISTADSPVAVWIVPTNEEGLIARQVSDLLS